MSWPATFAIALMTAVAGVFAAGFTANLAVSWYRIPGMEGQSGYFVVFLALAGGFAGFVLGGIVARMVTAGFLQAAGTALGVALAGTLLIGGAARLLADVPPQIGGDTLLLVLEYRWPASRADAPTAGMHEPHVQLGSVSGNVQRRAETGAFWLEDSRHEEGRWITPAAVEVFTERGRRMVSFIVDDSIRSGVLVPLPRRPGREQLEWSAWLPADATPGPDGAQYRFRVHRTSQPIRSERFGPFQLVMHASGFWLQGDPRGRKRVGASATFDIQHNGEPVSIEHAGRYSSGAGDTLRQASVVAVVHGPQPALLACMSRYDRPCFLLTSEGGRLRTRFVADLAHGEAGHELTSDSLRYETSRARTWLSDGLDRELFEQDRVYQLGTALLDTRDLSVHAVNEHADLSVQRWEPPVALAPDSRSYVRIGSADPYRDVPVLVVNDLDGGNAYTLPLDRGRMRFVRREDIRPAWVLHHFEWVRNGDGTDRLAERRNFVPLPYRGVLDDEIGGYRQYRIDLAREELLEAFLEFLFDEMGADRSAERDEYQTQYRVVFDGMPVKVGYNDSGGYVYALTDPDSKHAYLIAQIAGRFDAALATGRYDDLFVS